MEPSFNANTTTDASADVEILERKWHQNSACEKRYIQITDEFAKQADDGSLYINDGSLYDGSYVNERLKAMKEVQQFPSQRHKYHGQRTQHFHVEGTVRVGID